MTDQVAVIGAGITGITCAQALAKAGLRVRVFDKGRGIGGRMATRHTASGLRFDHGAQDLPATDAEFAAQMQSLGAAPWQGGAMVGCPGMSSIPKAMAQGLNVTQGAMVAGLRATTSGWRLAVDDVWHEAETVVLTIPAPQARDLLGGDHAFHDALADISYDPCIALMAGLDKEAPQPFASAIGQGASAWIAHDGGKPARQEQPLATWVMQADAKFSAQHIDRGFDELARMMAPILLEKLGADADALQHAVAHRWLYSRTARALGQSFLADDGARLLVGGDWALGPDVQHGWASGRAMAAHILSRR